MSKYPDPNIINCLTPPTVGQPPVAEMSDEELLDALIDAHRDARRKAVQDENWEIPRATAQEAQQHFDDTRDVVLDRLAQARPAPPSDGMVDASAILAAIQGEGWTYSGIVQAIVDAGLCRPDEQWLAYLQRLEDERQRLAAPSGGPDVE